MDGPARAAWPALLLLAACSSEPAPGGVSADEARQLNEAAAALDANGADAVAADNEGEP